MTDVWTVGPTGPDAVIEHDLAPALDSLTAIDARLVVAQIWADVNAQIAQRTERPGARPLSKADQRQLAAQLVTDWLESRMLSAMSDGLPLLSAEQESQIRNAVLAEMFDLGGRLEALMADDSIEDIYIAGTQPVIVKFADGRRQIRPPVVDSVDQLRALLQRAGEQSQATRAVTDAQPWLNTRLQGRARLAAVWDVTAVPHVTIRRHRYVDITLEQLVQMGTLSAAQMQVLAAAVRARLSILVVGGQSTGKTTLLRALARCLPRTERFATLETEHELLLDEIPGAFPGLIPAEERQGMGELARDGRRAGEVTLDDLFPPMLRHSLDRIIIGEVRGPEVRAVLKAMTRGLRGSMASFHADSPAETITALASLMSEYQPNWSMDAAMLQISQAVDLIVYIDREVLDDGREIRFVSHIHEVAGVAEMGRDTRNPLFEPLTTKAFDGGMSREERVIDPRGYATGTGGHGRAAQWLVQRGRLDPRWLHPENSAWTRELPEGGWW